MARVLLTASMVTSIAVIELLDLSTVLRSSVTLSVFVVVVTVVLVAATVPLVNPVAAEPNAFAVTVIPAELLEFKSIPERKVVTVRSPETEPLSAIPV